MGPQTRPIRFGYITRDEKEEHELPKEKPHRLLYLLANNFPMVCNLYIHLVLDMKRQSCLVLKEDCVNRFDSCVIWLVFLCPFFLWMTIAMDLNSNGYIVNVALFKGISLKNF